VPPNAGPLVSVKTESGKTRYDVGSDAVVCQYLPGFPQAPVDPPIGAPYANDEVLNYGQTYHLQGWTIVAGEDGTRFTNDGTGHGMFVSIDNVSSF
jgi:hypothetical protein